MQRLLIGERPRKGAASKLKQADTVFLIDAIGILYFEYQKANKEPGAEKWSRCGRCRRDIMDAIFDKWSILSGEDCVFPWSEDYVLLVWVAFRKQTDEVKCEWKEFLGQ